MKSIALRSFIICLFACNINKAENLLSKNIDTTRLSDNEILVKNNANIKDYTSQVYNLISNNPKNIALKFEKGTYHFYPEKALQRYVKITNNDNGLKHIAFPIIDYDSFELVGNETDFVFHGSMIPFEFYNSKNIKLKGINIYWDKPFTFEGEVINRDDTQKTFTIKVSKNNDYEIKDGVLFFKGYDWELTQGETIFFDKEKLRPYENTSKYLQWNKLTAKELSKGVVQFSGYNKAKTVPPIGSIYIDKGPHGQNRRFPAFHFSLSSNINLSDINVHASGAMALIAERCNGATLNNFNILLQKGTTQMISASADATHFVNCKGLISFDNCRFENMLDDATNVHGTYMIVKEIIGTNKLTVKPMHYQQDGFDLAQKGDTLRFIQRTNLQPIESYVVKEISQINDTHYEIEFDSKLSENIIPEIAVENVSWMASVVMKNCTIRQNRARSILISTSKKVEILNNYFSSMMAGIRVCGDANYWFESGPVTDLTIRGNTFEDIGIGGGKPQAILQIDPIIAKKYRGASYFHKNIIFDKNIVKTFDPHIVYALSVDNLQITNNEIIQTKTYKSIFNDLSQFDIQNCNNVLIENNSFKGDTLGEISVTESTNVVIKANTGFKKETVSNPNKYFFQN